MFLLFWPVLFFSCQAKSVTQLRTTLRVQRMLVHWLQDLDGITGTEPGTGTMACEYTSPHQC